MKKLFACALILTTLSSVGSTFFASTLNTNITNKSVYRPCGLRERAHFVVVIKSIKYRLDNHVTLVQSYITNESQNIQELFDTAFANYPEQHRQATQALQWFTHPGRQNVGLDCPYAHELIQHIRNAVAIIRQQNPLY